MFVQKERVVIGLKDEIEAELEISCTAYFSASFLDSARSASFLLITYLLCLSTKDC